MKRRNFNFLCASSVAALGAGMGFPKKAKAAALTTADADRLKSELTPMGAERAGNADGSIPAWTGDNLPLPPGSGPYGLLPDFFASDAKLVSINASNMAQYKDKLSNGFMAMMTKYPNFRIDVYPTHRTALATQEIYDNIYANVTRAEPASGGSRFGFTGAYGGIPFPIPNQDDPLEGGAQLIWNHSCRWQGVYQKRNVSIHTMIDSQLVLCFGELVYQSSPYYYPGGTPANYNGWIRQFRADVWGPPESKGQSFLQWDPTNPTTNPIEIWEYLSGQGRVRKAPELQYGTPESQSDDIINYDETYLWLGAMDQYDWKLIGKKEIYIPYNNNKAYLATAAEVQTPDFMNPDMIRWELHRVWVVDATLHAGQRNVLPHRIFYVDEDTMSIALTDSYDAQGNIFHVGMNLVENRPDIPGTVLGPTAVYNIQSGHYVTVQGIWNESPTDQGYDLSPIPDDTYQPQAMAASQQY